MPRRREGKRAPPWNAPLLPKAPVPPCRPLQQTQGHSRVLHLQTWARGHPGPIFKSKVLSANLGSQPREHGNSNENHQSTAASPQTHLRSTASQKGRSQNAPSKTVLCLFGSGGTGGASGRGWPPPACSDGLSQQLLPSSHWPHLHARPGALLAALQPEDEDAGSPASSYVDSLQTTCHSPRQHTARKPHARTGCYPYRRPPCDLRQLEGHAGPGVREAAAGMRPCSQARVLPAADASCPWPAGPAQEMVTPPAATCHLFPHRGQGHHTHLGAGGTAPAWTGLHLTCGRFQCKHGDSA